MAVACEKGIEQASFIELQRLSGHYENSCGGSRLEKESQRKISVAWQLRIVVKKGETSERLSTSGCGREQDKID